jgi:predicted dehydrogenase
MVGGGREAFIGAVHRMAARLDDRFTLVAGALSSDPARARASGVDLLLDRDRVYETVEELVRREAVRPDPVDVIAIVTPNHLHHHAASLCLDAGFHVVCDKPMTTNVTDAEALCASARQSGRLLAVTYNYSGYPLVRAARQMVEAGDLGSIHRVHVEYLQD